MMWCGSLSLCSFLLPFLVSSPVLINEVYYDHPGRDDGFEFVELVNTTDGAVALDGYALEFHDGSSGDWKTVWRAAPSDTLAADTLFVVGGENVSPAPDVIVDLALQNGPDAIRLTRAGLSQDRVGYGELTDTGLFEGRPAPDVPEGVSLSRRADGVDTDDNSVDFVAAPPSPGGWNRPRRDVAIEAVQTALRSVLEVPGPDRFRIRMTNRGTAELVPGVVTVVLVDSTTTGAVPVGSAGNELPIGPGESDETEFVAVLSHGLHRVRAEATLDGDERPRNNAVGFVRRVGYPPLLVSEVMSRPARGCPEYVELFNATGEPYDLRGHWIRDATRDPSPIVTTSTIVPAGGYVVITADVDALRACFPGLPVERSIALEGAWPTLNHAGSGATADSVVVLDGERLPVDAVAYPPQPADTEGRSLERVDLYPGRAGHAWTLSSSPAGGTPGDPNGSVILEAPTGGGLKAAPNPFAPSRGERLLITAAATQRATRAVVYVYDIEGRRLGTVGSSNMLPFVFVWEGREQDGRLVPPGIYIVACEFLGAGGSWVEKVVVGCAK